MLLILLASGLVAGMTNLLHPNRIPWIQDWENYVEAKAIEAGIEVIPLSLAHTIHETGEHLFVDARSSAEFAKGRIPGALSLSFEDFENHLDELEQVLESDKTLAVYCRNRECDDALLLALELRSMGLSNLLYYVDGYELWEEMGCSVEAD